MRFDIVENSFGNTSVYIKEKWYKPIEFIGTFPVPTYVILQGIKHLLLRCGCSEEDADRVVKSAKFNPSKGDEVLDIREKGKGIYAVRKLKWFLGIKYYKTLLLVAAENEDEVTRALIECFPDHQAIHPLTGDPY